MLDPARLPLILALLYPSTSALDALLAEGNPHDAQPAAGCCPAQALPPSTLLLEAAALSRQADTFVRVRTRKHGGASVPVFTFRQPARLSKRELPFDLALVSEIDPSGITEVPAPAAEAADSWFTDYAWSHFVVCTGEGTGAPKHLGWRFSRKASAGAAGPASFVALIVRAEQNEAADKGAVRAAAPLAAAAAVSDDVEERDGGEASPPPLPVGVEAPAWLVQMLVALTARATTPPIAS